MLKKLTWIILWHDYDKTESKVVEAAFWKWKWAIALATLSFQLKIDSFEFKVLIDFVSNGFLLMFALIDRLIISGAGKSLSSNYGRFSPLTELIDWNRWINPIFMWRDI